MRLQLALLLLGAVLVASAHVRRPASQLEPALIEAEAEQAPVSLPSSPVLTDLNVKNFGEQVNEVSYKQATREELGKLLAYYNDLVAEHKHRITELRANLTAARAGRENLKQTADSADRVSASSLERFLRLQTRIEGLMLRLQGWAITNLRHQIRVLLNVDPAKFNATHNNELRRMRRALERASFELRESYNYLLKVVRAVDQRQDLHVFGQAPNQKELDSAIVETARVDLEMGSFESLRNSTLSRARNLRDALRKHRKYLRMYNSWNMKTRHLVNVVTKLLNRALLEARLRPEYPPVDDCPEYINGSVCVPKPADVNVRVKVHVNISKDGNSTVTLVSSNEPECTDLNSPKCQKAIQALHGKPVRESWQPRENVSAYLPPSAPAPPQPAPPTRVIYPPSSPFVLAAKGTKRIAADGYCVFPGDPACTLNDLSVAVGIHIDRDGTPHLIVGARSNSSRASGPVPGELPQVAFPFVAPAPPLPPPRSGIAVLDSNATLVPAVAILPTLQKDTAAAVGPSAGLPPVKNPSPLWTLEQLLNKTMPKQIITQVTPFNGTDGKVYVRVQRINNRTGEVVFNQSLPLNMTADLAWHLIRTLFPRNNTFPSRNPGRYFNLPSNSTNNATAPSQLPPAPQQSNTVQVPAYAFGEGAVNIVLPPQQVSSTQVNTSATVVDRPYIPALGKAAAMRGRKLITTQRIVTLTRKRKDGSDDVQTRVFTDVKDVTPPPPTVRGKPLQTRQWDQGANVVQTAVGDMVVNNPNLSFKDRQAILRRIERIQRAIARQQQKDAQQAQQPRGRPQTVAPAQVPAGSTPSSNLPIGGSTAKQPRFRSNPEAQHFFESGVNSQSKPLSTASAVPPRFNPSKSLAGQAGTSDIKRTNIKTPKNQQNTRQQRKNQKPRISAAVLSLSNKQADSEMAPSAPAEAPLPAREQRDQIYDGSADDLMADEPGANTAAAALLELQSEAPPATPAQTIAEVHKQTQQASVKADVPKPASAAQKRFTNVEEEMRALHAQWTQKTEAEAHPQTHRSYEAEDASEATESADEAEDSQELGQLLDETAARLPSSLYKHLAKVAVTHGSNLDKVTAYEPREGFLPPSIAPEVAKARTVAPSRARVAASESEFADFVKLEASQLGSSKDTPAAFPWARDSGDVDNGEESSAESSARVDHSAEQRTEDSEEVTEDVSELSSEAVEREADLIKEEFQESSAESEAEDAEESAESARPALAKPQAVAPAAAAPSPVKGPFAKLEKEQNGAVVRGKPFAIDKKLAKLEPVLAKLQPTVNHDYSLHSHGHFPRVVPKKALLKKAEKQLAKMGESKAHKARLAASRMVNGITANVGASTPQATERAMQSAYDKIVNPKVTTKMLQDLAASQRNSSQANGTAPAPATAPTQWAPNPPVPGAHMHDTRNPVGKLVRKLEGPLAPKPRRHKRRTGTNATTSDQEWHVYPRVRTRVAQNGNSSSSVVTWTAAAVKRGKHKGFVLQKLVRPSRSLRSVDEWEAWSEKFETVGPNRSPANRPRPRNPSSSQQQPYGLRRTDQRVQSQAKTLNQIDALYSSLGSPPPSVLHPRRSNNTIPAVPLSDTASAQPQPQPQPQSPPQSKPQPQPQPQPQLQPQPPTVPKRTPSGFAPLPVFRPVPSASSPGPEPAVQNPDGSFVSAAGKRLRPATVEGPKWGRTRPLDRFDRDGLVTNLVHSGQISGRSVDQSAAHARYPTNEKLLVREGQPVFTRTFAEYVTPQMVPSSSHAHSNHRFSSAASNELESEHVVAPAQLGDGNEVEAEAAVSPQLQEAQPTLLSRLFGQLHA